MKNFIVKRTSWFDDEPDNKRVAVITRPIDMMGSETSITFCEKTIKENAFVFNPESEMVKHLYLNGTSMKEDPYYRPYTEITERIETDREETKHWMNGWKCETKQIWTKNN